MVIRISSLTATKTFFTFTQKTKDGELNEKYTKTLTIDTLQSILRDDIRLSTANQYKICFLR